MNTFIDSPTMTRECALKFCNKIYGPQFVASIGSDCIIRHLNGTVLQNTAGVLLVGARCRQRLPDKPMYKLLKIYHQMEIHRWFLMQEGKEVANVCANFVVTGCRKDLNTKLNMVHSAKDDKSAISDMQMRSKLRSIFINKHTYPIVKHEFGWLYQPVNTWLEENNPKLFAHFVSGVTPGKLFWPCSHTDPDVWFTVLVCLDYIMGEGLMVRVILMLVLLGMSFSVNMVIYWFTIQLIIMEQWSSCYIQTTPTLVVCFLPFS
jgi:hypothetical protein